MCDGSVPIWIFSHMLVVTQDVLLEKPVSTRKVAEAYNELAPNTVGAPNRGVRKGALHCQWIVELEVILSQHTIKMLFSLLPQDLIREAEATTTLPHSSMVYRRIFILLKVRLSTSYIRQSTEALLYGKWYFRRRHKTVLCRGSG